MNATQPDPVAIAPSREPTPAHHAENADIAAFSITSAVIVDQVELFRLGLRQALSDCSIYVSATATSLNEGVRFASEQMADLLIVGKFTDLKKKKSLRAIIRENPRVRFMLFVEQAEVGDVAGFISAGVHALLLRSARINEFEEALRRLQHGERFVASALAVGTIGRVGPITTSEDPLRAAEGRAASAEDHAEYSHDTLPDVAIAQAMMKASLTARELEVLAELATGASYADIAAALIVSLATVKTHLVHIYAKLGVRNRQEAVAKSLDLGILG